MQNTNVFSLSYKNETYKLTLAILETNKFLFFWLDFKNYLTIAISRIPPHPHIYEKPVSVLDCINNYAFYPLRLSYFPILEN